MQTNRWSRRSFLGAGVGAAAAIAAACGEAGTGGGGRSTTPVPGGRLRAVFAGSGAQEVLDPHRTNFFADIARSKALYDKLADFGDDLAPVPRLAAEWSTSADAATWTVKLRKATWHDGRRLTADDVLYSYSRILDRRNALRPRSSLAMIDMARSSAVDSSTLRFALNRPYADFPNAMAALGAYIVPAGTTEFSTVVGTGPFRFVRFDPGRSLLAERFDDYFDGAPYLDELEIMSATDESARVNALVGGQVEYADDLTPTSARTHERTPSIRVLRSPRSGVSAFAMKTDRPPFDSVDLRRAMFSLVDRPQLLSSVFNDFGEVGNDLFGKGFSYYADDIGQRSRNLDEARELVKRAGAQGLSIELQTTSASNGLLEAANILREQAAEVDLDIRVVDGDPSTFWSRTVDGGVLSSFRSGAMPIEAHISQRMLSDSPKNYTRWRRPEFDKLFVDATSTTDERLRREAFHTMQTELHSDGGLLIWGITDGLNATAAAVQGISTTAPSSTLGYARFDKAWIG